MAFLPENLGDWLDAAVKAVALLGIPYAVMKGLRELRDYKQKQVEEAARRDQELQTRKDDAARRLEEQTWRKTALAREILEKLSANPLATAAMRMLDWDDREYVLPGTSPAVRLRITAKHIRKGLRTKALETMSPEDEFIRDCFDSFFDETESIQHYVDLGLITVEEVRHPLRYYANQVAEEYSKEVAEFLRYYEYRRTKHLFDGLRGLPDTASSNEVAQTNLLGTASAERRERLRA